MGSQQDADTLQRTWGSISEQPLEIQLIDPVRQLPATEAPTSLLSDELFERAAAADVLLYPVSMLAEMVSRKRVMPLLASETVSAEFADADAEVPVLENRSAVPVALRMATSIAGEKLAKPLGGYLPSLMLGESSSDVSVPTWDDYTALVESSDGKCSEPTAPQWAGAMYLWRLASSLQTTWLFDRESLAPLLTQPEYVAVLQQMKDAVAKSSPEYHGLTPGEIYRAVANGELQAGIGFPQLDTGPEADGPSGDTVITFKELPGSAVSSRATGTEDERRPLPHRAMVDPFMLVGSMAASCRQTAAAGVFLEWIGGGQGSEPLYRNISSLVNVATPASESSTDMAERYRAWLSTQLSSPGFVPTLQLAGAAEYYNVLDRKVRECVLGELSAEVACEQISEAWSKLHQKHDRASQKRMWRRARSIG
ncbi:hypothetical protein CA85_44150 [Allorhodopirellula solitaria]|uniref:Bacterial extracellular solute-binding protein n=2 Tax=Allorhodopirellula solitaria TaxID=2527987 RepID=A0A5C5X246_9BACT|nr:hypothetical protein CA85_44150 [Allorhodopirellula solitaria]